MRFCSGIQAWAGALALLIAGVAGPLAVAQATPAPAELAATAAPSAPLTTSTLLRGDAVEALAAHMGQTSITLTAAALLADPMPRHPEVKWLYDRRTWLVEQPASVATFKQIADEFAQRRAWFSATEMLWFARVLSHDDAERAALNEQMKGLVKQSERVGAEIEQAEQIWRAGRPMEALEQIQAIIKANPTSELAYYKIADLYYHSYLAEEEKSEKLLMPSLRGHIFRLCYEMLVCTVVIDPLYVDAYTRMNEIRALLMDNEELGRQTEVISTVALNFKTRVEPSVAKLENDKRELPDLLAAAEALESVQQLHYAALLYRIALAHPQMQAQQASEISEKINALVARIKK